MQQDNELIFISIASYRDMQLVPTVEDLLAKADEPALLRFGICWQHGPEQSSLRFSDDPRFKILDVPWQESRGACWARAKIMELWQEEQWFLQVDSHCRFVKGWDTKLVRTMAQCGRPKPVISTYATAFSPANPDSGAREILEDGPQVVALEMFTSDGIPKLKPIGLPASADQSRPVAARFLAAGFIFAQGSFVRDVPYDPELYFFGEEISMTLRAYTSGYDLFHPVESIVWHDYVRAYATRHWEDHTEPASQTDKETAAWGDLDLWSRNKVVSLLNGDRSGEIPAMFDLGTSRTKEDYEAYAGLSFRLRKAQDYTRRALEPPNPPAPSDWPDRIYTWLIRVTLDPATLDPSAFDRSGFWVVAIEDDEHLEIGRRDFLREELAAFTGKEPKITLICEMQSGIIPEFWSVLPFSRERGWANRVRGHLDEADYSIIREDEDESEDAAS